METEKEPNEIKITKEMFKNVYFGVDFGIDDYTAWIGPVIVENLIAQERK